MRFLRRWELIMRQRPRKRKAELHCCESLKNSFPSFMETVSSLQWSNPDPDKANPISHLLFLYLSEWYLNIGPASVLCNSGSPIALCVCVCVCVCVYIYICLCAYIYVKQVVSVQNGISLQKNNSKLLH